MLITQKQHHTFGSNILMFETDKLFCLTNRDSMVGPLKMQGKLALPKSAYAQALSLLHTRECFWHYRHHAGSFTKATTSLVILAVMLPSWLLLTWEQLFQLSETIWSSHYYLVLKSFQAPSFLSFLAIYLQVIGQKFIKHQQAVSLFQYLLRVKIG